METKALDQDLAELVAEVRRRAEARGLLLFSNDTEIGDAIVASSSSMENGVEGALAVLEERMRERLDTDPYGGSERLRR